MKMPTDEKTPLQRQPFKTEENRMKNRHLIALLQDGFTTIQVTFETQGIESFVPKRYTYKARLEDNIVVGDHVIVDSPSKGFTVVKVVGVDPAPRIDLDVNWTYKWIVQKVDARWYTEQLEREQFVADTLVEVERRRQRDLLLTEFQNMLPEGTSARELFDATVLKLKTDRE